MSVSEDTPIFWVDVHSEHQRGFDFQKAAEHYELFAIKINEGPYRDGSVLHLDNLAGFVREARQTDKQILLYNFNVESRHDDPVRSGRLNAEAFLRAYDRVGEAGDWLVADFEGYPIEKYSYLSPSNGNLEAFGDFVLRRTDDPYIIYSGPGWWNSGNPSGDIRRYGTDLAWDAQYANMREHDNPRQYYDSIEHWGWRDSVWGNVKPIMWQFTSAGLVAGKYVDVNALRIPKAQVRERFANGIVKPAPDADTLPEYVRKPLAYLEKTKGGPYTPWVSGHFRDGVPAWCENSAPPNPDRVASNGAFCAGMLNLACRVNGKHIFQDTANWWAGGVAWWGEHLANAGVLKDYDRSRNYPPGTLFIEFYRGAALANQGHVAIQGRHGNLIQSDALEGVPKPGINEKRTHAGTHDLLRRFGGRGWERVVLREDWLK